MVYALLPEARLPGKRETQNPHLGAGTGKGIMAHNVDRNGIRASVFAFAEAMEAKLRENDHKGGWKECNLTYLEGRLHEETRELSELFQRWHLAGSGFMGYRRDEVNEQILREAADVANFAMMIADVCGALSANTRKRTAVRSKSARRNPNA